LDHEERAISNKLDKFLKCSDPHAFLEYSLEVKNNSKNGQKQQPASLKQSRSSSVFKNVKNGTDKIWSAADYKIKD